MFTRRIATITPSVSNWAGATFIVLLAFGLLLPWFHTGFQASDDASYLAGGLGWIEHFPYIGNDHWTLRHTITIPIAVSVLLFGANEWSISLPNAVYCALFLAVNTIIGGRLLGLGASMISGLLLVTMPGVLVLAGYLNPDLPELLFLSVAFWAFVFGCDSPRSTLPWLICGVAWSLAFLNRETALGFALFLGILFLFKPIVQRSRYFLIAAGALPLLLVEWVYLFAATGDPLYRYRVDYHHDVIDRAMQVARTMARQGIIDGEGNLTINVYIDPVLNLIVSQKYGIVFWLAAVAAWQLWKKRSELGQAQRPLMLLGAFGVVFYLFVALNPRLYLVPRYFMVFAWTASLIAGYWLAMLWRDAARRRLVVALVAGALGVNLLGLMLENTNPRFAERELANWVAQHPGESVYSDPETVARSEYFFRFRRVRPDGVETGKPRPGSLVFFNPDGIRRCNASQRCRGSFDGFRPDDSWREIARIEPPERVIIKLGRGLGLDRLLPEDLARRLTRPVNAVVLYRIESPASSLPSWTKTTKSG
jgi:Dolichyl-phosphate-mannose-protein mannosyltransferase